MRRQRHPQPVKAHIVLSGRTQRELAERIGVSAHYLGQVVNGFTAPSDRMRSALAAELGMPAELLFRADDRQAVA